MNATKKSTPANTSKFPEVAEERGLNLLITDDQPLVLKGIRAMLENEHQIENMYDALSGKETLKVLSEQHIDLVLLDLRMPEMSGAETILKIKQDYPKVKVLVLTISDDGKDIAELLINGADGYILKDVDSEELMTAINRVVSGKSYFSARVHDSFMEYTVKEKKPAPTVKITPRQEEILRLLAVGLTSKEIAKKLFRSPATVETHIQTLIKKTKVRNRMMLIRFAVEHGFLD